MILNEKIDYKNIDCTKTYTSPFRTITDEDISQFLILTGLKNPIFTDKNFAEQHSLGWRLVPAPLLIGIAIGLTDSLISGTVKAVVEIEKANFIKPVKVLDTIQVKTQAKFVEDEKGDKKRDLGLLIHKIYNQKNTLVYTLNRKLIFLDMK